VNRWDAELADTLHGEKLRRGPSSTIRKPRRKPKRSSVTAGLTPVERERFARLRGACCDWSPVDPDEQAMNVFQTLKGKQ
jgi:hypothetical protein